MFAFHPEGAQTFGVPALVGYLFMPTTLNLKPEFPRKPLRQTAGRIFLMWKGKLLWDREDKFREEIWHHSR